MKPPTSLVLVLATLLIVQSHAKPCTENSDDCGCDSNEGESYVKESKTTKKSATTSTEDTEVSYEEYKAGSSPCADSLPARKSGECDEDYYKRIFCVDVNDKDSVANFYEKVFRQYTGECNNDYVERIEIIFTKSFIKLDCRTNVSYIKYLEKYYTLKYGILDGEKEIDFFKRVLTKTTETEEEYTAKITIMKKYITKVDWSKVEIDYKSKAGFTVITRDSTETTETDSDDSKSCTSKKTWSEEEIKTTYAKKQKEDKFTYYKRIVSKVSTTETTEEYNIRITLIRKCFSTLDLWSEIKYIELVSTYYTNLYTQQNCESQEVYFKRIVTKESYETEEQCAKRVEVVRQLFPNLNLWFENKYYEKFTKKIYKIVFDKTKTEDIIAYFKRIVAKNDKETVIVYTERMLLIEKIFNSLSLWYSENTFNIVKQYYTLKYVRKSNECEEDLIKRLTAKQACDTTNEIYAARIHLVMQVTLSYSVWYENKYYEKFTKLFYTTFFKKSNEEACEAWLTRVIKCETGESEENAIKRITLINKSNTGCKCWTVANIKKLKCTKLFTDSYLSKILKSFVKCAGATIIKRGGC